MCSGWFADAQGFLANDKCFKSKQERDTIYKFLFHREHSGEDFFPYTNTLEELALLIDYLNGEMHELPTIYEWLLLDDKLGPIERKYLEKNRRLNSDVLLTLFDAQGLVPRTEQQRKWLETQLSGYYDIDRASFAEWMDLKSTKHTAYLCQQFLKHDSIRLDATDAENFIADDVNEKTSEWITKNLQKKYYFRQ